ncbi:carboxynorspermidine decarboxylase [bacterium]|jgi:carboxynorspermidine decarboxylase|nr:carboxynorspermidine decarboxylase [Verrucomicrobiota bacterium]MDA7632641.1 carboxynorspermidine decarboxylase [bacterium]MDA7657097.1 carboxynorspermidine decarboxylase [Verrucomicrobiota bacterium]MDA7866362.1 carboxynorspermidine decarboxylase [Verrucomicrobiota bacterium]MDB4746537.1 carboxynorspermidine decarboxylase [Verrucomicrobiota bacterium]
MEFNHLPSPCYVVDESILAHNLEVLKGVQDRTGARIILALKGFAMHRVFPQIKQTLGGTTASSVHEAQLGRELFGGEVHGYAPAYSDSDIDALLPLVDHLVFNSVSQFLRYKERVLSYSERTISIGLRINPEYSEVKTALYDPCRKGSRLGIRLNEMEEMDLTGVEGFHFHTMCEQNSDTLERTVQVVEEKFSHLFSNLKWFNFGGGHHVSRSDYDVERLCRVIEGFQSRTGLQVYMEPGEAIALNAGILVGQVLDIVPGEENNVILDLSATAHMPDVLEMPYRPDVRGAGKSGEKAYTYQLGGLTCLAGDQIGDYSFDQPLKIGDRLVFEDMAHYTMVKNTTFNGVQLPAIVLLRTSGDYEVVREFGYQEYRDRLS